MTLTRRWVLSRGAMTAAAAVAANTALASPAAALAVVDFFDSPRDPG